MLVKSDIEGEILPPLAKILGISEERLSRGFGELIKSWHNQDTYLQCLKEDNSLAPLNTAQRSGIPPLEHEGVSDNVEGFEGNEETPGQDTDSDSDDEDLSDSEDNDSDNDSDNDGELLDGKDELSSSGEDEPYHLARIQLLPLRVCRNPIARVRPSFHHLHLGYLRAHRVISRMSSSSHALPTIRTRLL